MHRPRKVPRCDICNQPFVEGECRHVEECPYTHGIERKVLLTELMMGLVPYGIHPQSRLRILAIDRLEANASDDATELQQLREHVERLHERIHILVGRYDKARESQRVLRKSIDIENAPYRSADAAQWLAADAASGRGDGRYQVDLSPSGDHDVEDAAGGPNR